MSIRTNKVIIVIGTRGVGKTDWAKSIIKIQEKNFNKVMIFDLFDNPVWHNMKTHNDLEGINRDIPIVLPSKINQVKKGLFRTYSKDFNEILENEIEPKFKDGFIVFEDATKYIEGNVTEALRSFVIDSKQKNVDILFIFHSLSDVPPKLIRWSDYFVLFKTNEGVPSKSKYPWTQIPILMEELRNDPSRYANRIFIP